MMGKIPVYILAGGKSRRFGSDKARALLSGKPLVLRVADVVRSFASRITVVAETVGKYEDLGLPTVADITPGCGPLGGLHTALRDCAEPALLLVSCDFVGVRPAWIEALLEHKTEATAVAFKGSHWEPMPAVFYRSILSFVDRRMGGNDRAMASLLEETGAAALPLPADWPEKSGINTPEELREEGRAFDG